MIPGRQTGLSLIELMISAAIGLFLVAAGGKLYVTGKVNARIQSELEGIEQNARFALSQLVRDLRRSGYYGGLLDSRRIGGTEAAIEPDGSCNTGDNSWGRMLERPLFGLDDSREGYVCIPERDYLRGDILTVRFAEPVVANTYDSERLYLRVSPEQGRLFTGSKQDLVENRLPSLSLGSRRVVAHAYYIRPSTTVTCPDGSRPPSLYREALGSDGLPRAEEIAAGIENLQLLFGLRDDSTNMTRFVNADNVSNWNSVEQVKLWLLARQVCALADLEDSRESYGLADVVYRPEERKYRRELFVRTAELRNR